MEETSKNAREKTQPVNSTRRLLCSNTNSMFIVSSIYIAVMIMPVLGFVKQICKKNLDTDQPAWHPSLPNSCENGLLISEKLYLMVRS